jgi:hypothetical protein
MATTNAKRTASPAQSLALFRAKLAEIDEASLKQYYEMLGQLDYIYLEPAAQGEMPRSINYGKSGPLLAIARESINTKRRELVLLDAFTGFPDLLEAGQPCTDCVGECRDCMGKGKKQCTMQGCFGTGRRVLKHDVKPCEVCRGAGAIPQKDGPPLRCEVTGCVNGQIEIKTVTELCPCCKGSKFETCAPCKGTGRISTGLEGGVDINNNLWPPPKKCPKCNGKCVLMKAQRQDFTAFQPRPIEGTEYQGIGPIIRLVFHTGGLGATGTFESINVSPDHDGNMMMLIFEPNGRQYLLGGVALRA